MSRASPACPTRPSRACSTICPNVRPDHPRPRRAGDRAAALQPVARGASTRHAPHPHDRPDLARSSGLRPDLDRDALQHRGPRRALLGRRRELARRRPGEHALARPVAAAPARRRHRAHRRRRRGARGRARTRSRHPADRRRGHRRDAARSSSRSTSTAARVPRCGTSSNSATRAILHLAGPPNAPDAIERIRGWRDELAANRLDVVEPPHGDWSAASGYELGPRARRRAGNGGVRGERSHGDRPALGPARTRSAACPRTSASSASTTFPEAGYLFPPLTTVRQDFAALGGLMMQKVLVAVEEPEAPPRTRRCRRS